MTILFCSITKINCSDITSLASLSKDTKQIYIVGCFKGCSHNKRVLDSHRKLGEVLKDCLKSLSTSCDKTACLFLEEKSSVLEYNTHLFTYPHLYDYLKQEACTADFHSGNLTYLSLPSCVNESVTIDDFLKISTYISSTLVFPVILSKMGFPVKSLPDVENHLYTQPLFKKHFFKKDGMFDSTRPLLKSFGKNPSIEEYFNFLETCDKKIMSADESLIMNMLKKKWTLAKNSATSYLLLLKKKSESPELMDLVLDLISQKKSFISGLNEFGSLALGPLSVFKMFEKISVLLKTLATYDKIIVCCEYDIVQELIEYLEKIEFKGTTQGHLLNVQEIQFLQFTNNTFSDEVLTDFLACIAENRPLSIIDDQLPAQKRSAITYFDSSSNSFTEKFLYDYSVRVCHECAQATKVHNACAITKKGLYCSLDCLRKRLFQEEKSYYKLSTLLSNNHPLTNEEKLILKQFGALCYLRAASLMHSLYPERDIVYQLPLSSIISALELINKEALTTTTLWGQTAELSKEWGIKIIDLKFFLSAYKRLKESYLQALLKDSLYKRYNDLLGEHHTLFDEKGICTTLQKVAFTKIKNALTVDDTTKDISILFLYNDLIEHINNRVGFTVESVQNLLTGTSPHQDLTKVLEFIGYTENPLNFRKKVKNKKIVSFSTDHSISSEESSEEDACCLPKPTDYYFLHTTSAESETGFSTVQRKQKKVIPTIKSSFAGCSPYTISLFKARKYIPEELQSSQLAWKECKKTVESHRIKTLFALADIVQDQNPVIKLNSFGCLALDCNESNYDKSLTEKLDLHHLFTRLVDTYLSVCGIAERVDNLIQVSIPGELTDKTGTKKVGFFQYSFTSDSWICIHRCFKSYDANQQGIYISSYLRKILHDFLLDSFNTTHYTSIIEHLKQLIT